MARAGRAAPPLPAARAAAPRATKEPGFSCGYIDALPCGEVKVVTAPPPRPPHRFIPHGIMPRAQGGLPGPDGKPPTWSQRLEALKHVAPLLRLVYQTHRGYTV